MAEALGIDLASPAAWLHELRDEHGRWVHDNAALLKAATGRKASAVRLHDHVLFAKVEMRPDRMGFVSDQRPMEVTGLHHHWERHGRQKRRRYTDLEMLDPDTGETHSQSMPDGSSVKLFPREALHPPRQPRHRAPPPAPAEPSIWEQVQAALEPERPPALSGAAVHEALGKPRMSADQQAAFNAYESPTPATGFVNDYLHGKAFNGQPVAAQRQAVAMDSVFAQAAPTPAPMTLYRGMNDKRLAGVGSVFTDDGYVSATSDPKIADEFKKQRQRVRVHVPAGSRAVSVALMKGEAVSTPLHWDILGPEDQGTGDTAEREVLLPRGSRFKITGVSPQYVDMVLLS